MPESGKEAKAASMAKESASFYTAVPRYLTSRRHLWALNDAFALKTDWIGWWEVPIYGRNS